MTTMTVTSKNNGSSYAIVAGSEDTPTDDNDEIIVHGRVVSPFCDRRKSELCISFGAGVLLTVLFYSMALSFQHPASSPAIKPVNTENNINKPPQFPVLNETDNVGAGEEIIEDKGTTTSSWWSNTKHTVGKWFGMNHETKITGQGRDWLLNAQTGSLVSKQDPSLFLGIGPAPLVLVREGSKQELVFDLSSRNVELSDLEGEFVGFSKDDDEYNALAVSPFLDPISVTYQEDNFIVFESDYILEVDSWKLAEKQKVNVVKSDGDFVTGGGCDWIWSSEDGTIRPKLNKELVLGRGDRGLVVTRETDQALAILHSKDLANIGHVVPMDLGKGEKQVVGVKPSVDTKDGWHTKETILVDKGPVRIKYDGNFLLTVDEQFALDIANGKLEEGNMVNFVGGDS